MNIHADSFLKVMKQEMGHLQVQIMEDFIQETRHVIINSLGKVMNVLILIFNTFILMEFNRKFKIQEYLNFLQNNAR